jgi:hypothetical protein
MKKIRTSALTTITPSTAARPRLALHREVIRELTEVELEAGAGGGARSTLLAAVCSSILCAQD